MTHFVFIRHGQATGNLEDIVQGWLDRPLTKLGETQVESLTKHLPALPDLIIASDLLRAQQTAHIIQHSLRPQPALLLDWHFRERYFGELEGQPNTVNIWEHSFAMITKTPATVEPNDFFEYRIRQAINSTKLLQAKTIFVVAHNNVLNRIARYLNPSATYQEYPNASFIEADITYQEPWLQLNPVKPWKVPNL